MVYRVVEEVLAVVGPAGKVSVRGHPDGRELSIAVDGARQAIAHERLTVLTARLELVGGTLTATPTELRAVIPLRGDGGEALPERGSSVD